MIDRFCVNCVHWKPCDDDTLDGFGECRRYAPRTLPEGLFWYVWPKTQRGDWCGELLVDEAEERSLKEWRVP